MNAKEAKQMSEKARVPSMERIYQAIHRAASVGDTALSYSIEGINENQVPNIISTLKKDGYEVKRDRYSDYRDSYDNLTISW